MAHGPRSRWRILATAAAALLVLSSCGGDGSAPRAQDRPRGEGAAARAGGAGVRTVRITALDTLRFDPARVTVEAGVPVRFVVTNVGETPHEFVLGDRQAQLEHEQMAAEGMGHDHGGGLPALELEPGETQEAEVTFSETGTVLYGCHVPGHWDGGMVGRIQVA